MAVRRETQCVVEDLLIELESAAVVCTPQNVGSYASVVDPETRERLVDYLRPHNERLYVLLDRDLRWR